MKPPELMVETPYDVRCPWMLRCGEETAKIHVDVAIALMRYGVGTTYDGVVCSRSSFGRLDMMRLRMSLQEQVLCVEWDRSTLDTARLFERSSPRLRSPRRTATGYRAELKITKKAARMLRAGLPGLELTEQSTEGDCHGEGG